MQYNAAWSVGETTFFFMLQNVTWNSEQSVELFSEQIFTYLDYRDFHCHPPRFQCFTGPAASQLFHATMH